MADKGAHPGVKSLLARFENNQQSTASPPPRDRSPAGSDLSKVRASFVAVEGGSPSGPVLGLRRVSPQSEGFPSPSRVKSFSSEDLDGSVKSNGSSTQPTNGLGTPQKVNEPEKKDTPKDTVEAKGKEKVEETSSANKENHPVSTSPTVAPTKSTKTVPKKPSDVHAGKATSTTKPASQASSKISSQSRTPASANRPENEKPRTRVSRPSTTTTTGVKNDSVKAPVHKSSRASLATSNKAPTRPAARETTRSAARSSDVRSSSTARPARPANSATTTSTSAARSSATAGATSNLSRKPSSLKSATGTRQRAITPSASSVRKPASRSPPSGSDRSNSRASTASKPVDEGFLARMMRPTASSANKAHEKLDVKSPPRTKVARAPRRIPSTRSTQSTKEKVASHKPAEVEEQPAIQSVDAPLESEQKAEPEPQTVQEITPEPSVGPSAQAPEPAVDSAKSHEIIAEAPVEAVAEPITEPVVEPTDSKSNELDVTPTTEQENTDEATTEPAIVEQQVTRAEATEPIPEDTEEKTLAPAAEIIEKPTGTANTYSAGTKTAEPIETDAVAVAEEKKPDITSEGPLNSNQPDVDDIDLSKWSLNDDDDTF
ncbi:uncharacterized protein DSM5745_08808 [Aspergillus mulundensis]|uniref:Mucin-7 n=1 Tax=Aspergillus mulundensis TaxID=1810919 RepID=A0A3D8R502_9EURO|nr:Uncharacterized protein DSM5745_08808 [Aspergillus mulundensis]RDW69048.1 Uncharacterized protein DSM5745_08808 [Aspergillus mulundensis]